MVTSRLSLPDDVTDQADPMYSKSVAAILGRAYKLVRARASAQAKSLLLACLNEQMTMMQRLRLLYILGLATTAGQQHVQALAYVDEALDLAIEREDLDSAVLLAYLGGDILHNLQRFTGAARYYSIALDALRSGSGTPVDPVMEFDLLRGLATEAFLCARYGASTRFLRAARRITLPGDMRHTREGALEWMQAMLHRWRGQPDQALGHALTAFDLYAPQANQIELSRLRILLAETYLDLVQPGAAPGGLRRETMLSAAEPHMLHALASTRVTGDRAAEGMALLAYARYQVITGDNGNAMATIDLSESIALELEDLPLLAQSHTARGQTFSAANEVDAARVCYRAALDVLRQSSARAYAAAAQRALRREEEMRE